MESLELRIFREVARTKIYQELPKIWVMCNPTSQLTLKN